MTLRARFAPAGRLATGRLPLPRGRLSWALAAVPLVITAAVVLALAGAARDDAHIDARTGHATAQVLAVGSMRTVVQFAGPNGEVYSPDEGLAYPSGLQVGQLVRAEYDLADPEEVRVEGRSWTIGLGPASVTLLVLWVVLVPAGYAVRRRLRS
ncbi:MAG TPA: DUF3592 domain-containing protein [Pseudonocardiaceae bacterium]|jgi:hypothetical protein